MGVKLNSTIIGSGAEAVISLNKDIVLKNRISKRYRHPDIDEKLRATRTRKESKILIDMQKAGIAAPKLILNGKNKKNDAANKYIIEMEYIKGPMLKRLLDSNPKLARHIGENLSKMHDINIIHGDLTTSNMILQNDKKDKDSGKLYFIDFGLSFNSNKIEDKAVDIHLFKQSLESKHYKVYDLAYAEFLKGYNPKEKSEILKRLNSVEQRGRYKEKI